MAQIGRNESCPCGSGKKYKKCHGSTVTAVEKTGPMTGGGFHASQDFNDRTRLRKIGPIIKGEWHVHPEPASELLARGKPLPKPVMGYFLIDTGAEETGIDGSVAEELSLKPVGHLESHGVGGAWVAKTYKARVALHVKDKHGAPALLRLHKDFACAPTLREFYDERDLKAPDGSQMRLIGILGRDILQFAVLTYNGLAGSWSMEIDESIVQQRRGA